MSVRAFALKAGVTTAGALLAGGALAPAAFADTTSTPTSTEPAGCPSGHLPAVVDGSPNVPPGAALGDYVWHSDHGWRLVVTHPGHDKAVFTGTITASAPISYAKVDDERNDVVHLSANSRTLTFRFTNFGYLDGVSFRADCAEDVHFSLQADGHQLPPDAVYLGAHRVHPTSEPFTIERRK